MLNAQCTLGGGASLCGRGLHTGEESCVTLKPAPPDTGIVFETSSGWVRAAVESVCATDRGTSLGAGGTVIHTVEHLLSALAGLGVDNARIEVDGPEVPAADGSALPFVELIESAGVRPQEAEARAVAVSGPVWVIEGDKCLLAVPGTQLRVSALISFGHPMIGDQAIDLRLDPETFKREIAPARTFCTAEEVESLRSRGLGRGGTEDNVVVAYPDRHSSSLRFRDEFVRHKVLDIIGDLSLVGGRLYANVVAIRSGHKLNLALAREIVRRATGRHPGWQSLR